MRKLFELFLNSEVDENLEVHDTLNPKIWEEDQSLNPKIKEKIELIVDTFLKILEEDEIPIEVKDVQLTGSNANYNYSDKSDIDVHIMADIKDDPKKYLSKIYNSYKTLFNNRYSITLKGIPVEIYVEDVNTANRKSHGAYSVIEDKWLVEPQIEEIPEIDEKELNKELNYWESRYSELLDSIDSGELTEEEYIQEIEDYINEIYQVRQEGLVEEGEYSLGNQLFKEVRNKDILDDLRSKKIELTSKLLSLDESK